MSSNNDIAVQSTCTDASSSKKYAVSRGYWQDNFVAAMVRSSPKAKQPEINQGYYARTEAIWILINKFLQATNKNCQIVSLGAGLDTSFWRLIEQEINPKRYVELDFVNVVRSKIHTIKSKPKLSSYISSNWTQDDNKNSIISGKYCLLPADLRDLSQVKEALSLSLIDYSLPTLFLTECVLVYMPSADSNTIIKWIADTFKDAFFINYEQLNMSSTFGHVMIENLKLRECELPGVDMCENTETQEKRFTDNGWTAANCVSMWNVFHMLPQSDVERIKRLEFLDEMELLQQLLSHYCLCWAYKSDVNSDIDLTDVRL